MPTVQWNVSTWDQEYSWEGDGDEWSQPWGNSSSQWYGTLLPRLHRLMPTARILEIAPGRGRWSQFLIPNCVEYLGIDLSHRCVESCRHRFASASRAHFEANDGLTLEAAEPSLFDLVFSFDSLVHCEIEVFESYIPQILDKLTRRGVAFVHHSNVAEAVINEGHNDHSRAHSMSAAIMAGIVEKSGGQILVQEIINWRGAGPIDCITTFGLPGGRISDPKNFAQSPVRSGGRAHTALSGTVFESLAFELIADLPGLLSG